ncbi:DNA-binding transcriptional MerR regulator [Catenulispora sp. EB89]|uniref:MerR family transcriptional regulator n=1 Tax=Catenulispora sp. EB89 TaxID=3156257 RepID=UPI003517BD41
MSGEALTIGEVIGRLAADFPDLTVSKIRYLESGGLISPGRTPAGYRRFSEEDVEKLRWVLAAQRDQYLPLKVIRQHLAADGPRVTLGDADAIVAALTSGADLASVPDPDAEGLDDRGRAGQDGSGRAGRDGRDSAGRDSAGRVDAEHDNAPLPPTATLTPPLPPLPRTRAATVADPEFYRLTRADVGELHLGREALARTAGVSESLLADLVAYGLLPNLDDYGGDAVFIARAAAALTEYGLEPRHLRPLLLGARNTAGLLGTLLPTRRHDGVTGSGRQAAASRAASRTAEAAAAAVKLYAALLRAELAGGAAPAGQAQHGPPVQQVPQSQHSTAPTAHAPSAPVPAQPPVPEPEPQPTAPAALVPPAPADAPPPPSAPASRESSGNPGMPGGPAAR